MNAELETIKDAWDKGTGDGRDRKTTINLADAYIAAHPDEFNELRDKSIEDCVKALSVFRDAGMDEQQWIIEAWLLHHFEPQQIGGAVEARVRVPGLG